MVIFVASSLVSFLNFLCPKYVLKILETFLASSKTFHLYAFKTNTKCLLFFRNFFCIYFIAICTIKTSQFLVVFPTSPPEPPFSWVSFDFQHAFCMAQRLRTLPYNYASTVEVLFWVEYWVSVRKDHRFYNRGIIGVLWVLHFSLSFAPGSFGYFKHIKSLIYSQMG